MEVKPVTVTSKVVDPFSVYLPKQVQNKINFEKGDTVELLTGKDDNGNPAIMIRKEVE